MNTEKIFKLLVSISFIFAVGIIVLAFLYSCASADKNITSKDFKCEKVTKDNAMSCCGQVFTGDKSSSAKDSVCASLVIEKREEIRENRKKENITFCENQAEKQVENQVKNQHQKKHEFQSQKKAQKKTEFQSCWDKLNSK